MKKIKEREMESHFGFVRTEMLRGRVGFECEVIGNALAEYATRKQGV